MGCASTPSPYSYVNNWVIRENAVPSYFAEYDLIYIYPRISRSGDRWPDLPPDRVTLSYVHDFSEFVTQEAFGKKVRVFAPVIHRTEDSVFSRLLAEETTDWTETEANLSIEETIEAIRYYLENYHEAKRPYVLLGHDQGSVVLYEAVKQLSGSEVRPSEGCVAVYLPELPKALLKQIPEEFGEQSDPKRMVTVKGRYDTGVIAAWRVVEASPTDVVEHPVKARGLVNPLNWSVVRPADESFNKNACYYDMWQTNVLERKISSANYVRAEPDGSNLCLRVARVIAPDQPEMPLVGETVSLFTGDIVVNAHERVTRYLCKARWVDWETEEAELPIVDTIAPRPEEKAEEKVEAKAEVENGGKSSSEVEVENGGSSSLLGDIEEKGGER